MIWFIFIIGLLIICWPLILRLLAPVIAFFITVLASPCIWFLRIRRRPTTQDEEDKLSEDAAKAATVLLFMIITALLVWWIIRTI